MNTRPIHAGVLLTAIVLTGCSLKAVADRAESASESADSTAAPAETRAAVQLALPYLARQTGSWIAEKKGTSCHQVPHALWAMNAARAAGFAVDSRVSEWNRWSVDFVLGEAEKSGGEGKRADELYQMLLTGSLADADVDPSQGSATARDRLISELRLARSDDGLWHAKGQLPDQKRAKRETNEATTMWSLLALRSVANTEKPQSAHDHSPPALEARSTSTEHLILRYLLSLEGKNRDESSALERQLLAHQHEDGGWGWLLEEGSDALATGQALYALSHMDQDPRRDTAVQRAHRFLQRTQQPDGSWQVPSTLREKENQPYVVANDWGTAWAVIGLTRTIGQ